VTGFRWLTALAFGLIVATGPSFGATFDTKEARKTCTAQYEREKEGGTIPAGMAKSKYVSQCVNSMRRDWELQQRLAAGGASSSASPTPAAGSNELAVSTPAIAPEDATQAKPARVATPAFPAPKGR
jgi:hypothetical protein